MEIDSREVSDADDVVDMEDVSEEIAPEVADVDADEGNDVGFENFHGIYLDDVDFEDDFRMHLVHSIPRFLTFPSVSFCPRLRFFSSFISYRV